AGGEGWKAGRRSPLTPTGETRTREVPFGGVARPREETPMDLRPIAMLIPIIALLIPVVAIVMTSKVKIGSRRAHSQFPLPPETEPRIAQLEDEVGSLRQELGETQERLDFTERLLVKKGENKAIGS